MMLTQSSIDGEALAAIRKANSILSKQGVNWEEFFAGISKQTPKQEVPKRGPKDYTTYLDADQIQAWFEFLDECELTDWESNFIGSIRSYFKRQKCLSIKQYETLERVVGNYA